MNPCYIGIDFGTSGARAAVIDTQQELLAEARTDYDLHSTASWRETLFELLSQIPAKYRQASDAIAIDATSSTTLLCDAANQPLCEPLPYHDARATAETEALHAIAPSGHVVLSASSSLAKLLWLAKQPECAGAHYFAHQADWLAAQLHGRPGVSDYHNSLKLGYDVQQLRYPDWLANLSIQPLLPQVLAPGAAIGNILPDIASHLGIARDCLIRAGTTDSIAAFLASGADQPGQAVTSLGSTLVLKLLSKTRVESAAHGIYSHRLGNLWLAGGASNSGGAVLKSFFSAQRIAELSARINPAMPSQLDYYPLMQPGERFPVNDPNLPPRLMPRPPDDVEFLHGLLESIARIEARGYRLLQELGATAPVSVCSSGGGAHNTSWTAIRTRILRLPVNIAKHAEAAYGAALLAKHGDKLV